MDLLASGTMAELGIQWFLTAQLILDFAAMAAPFVTDLEMFGWVMNFVGCTMLPFIELSLGGAHVSILAIGGVG